MGKEEKEGMDYNNYFDWVLTKGRK